jgi:ferredoxin
MLNARFAAVWPNVSDKKELPGDAEEYEGAEGKFDKFFGKSPGPAMIDREMTTLAGLRPPAP